MENVTQIWKMVLDNIRPEFQMQISYTTWIETITPVAVSENFLVLQVPFEYNRDIIKSRYYDIIKNSASFFLERPVELKIYLNSEEIPERYTSNNKFYNKPENDEKSDFKITNLNPQYVFDNFVIGKSNQYAHATSLAIAEGRGSSFNPFFLYGGVGLGKTHLMHAIGNYILKKNSSKKILYVSSEQFTNDMINAIRNDRNQEFRDKYRTVDILMVDNIQFISDKEGVQEEFFNTFNELHLNGNHIIISADRPPKDLPTFMDRLISRFTLGVVADINPPDYETRIAILRKKAFQLKLDIPSEVLEYTASKIKSNIRELEGAIKKIMIHHTLMNKEITIAVADEALKDIINEKKRKITPQLITSTVEKYFNLKENDLKSSSRSQNIAFPRQIAMYILKDITDLSLKQIGEIFGGKDHTTVMHAIKNVESKKSNDSTVEKYISDIMTDIRN